MTFTVTILGSNSAMPVYDRHPSAQLVNVNENLFLIDCGEGTQMQLQKYGIRYHKINHIFISHLHGDHFHGLLPLLDTFMLTDRKSPLYLFAPPDFLKVLELHQMVSSKGHKPEYPIIFQPVDAGKTGVIFENKHLSISTLPMIHGLPCTGFLLKQKIVDRKMKAGKIQEYQIPFSLIDGIKKGDNFITPSGRVISNQELTEDPPVPRSYAYCSDTSFNENLIPLLKGVDVLYHESTYLEDMQEFAAARGHSTATDAAKIASAAKVQRLYLGHFSSRYEKTDLFLKEARKVFKETCLALEGSVINVLE